jgi:hypothetical protein
VPAHLLVQPDEQRATRLQRCVVFFQLVVRYFVFAGELMPLVYPRSRSGAVGRFVQQSHYML